MNGERTIEFLLSHGASTDARLDKIAAILRRAIRLTVQRDRTLRAAQRRTDRRFDQLINILVKSGGTV